MPTYAYACKSCGHRFDAVQSFADPSLTVCPVCGGELRKQYGSIGVTFNGSGFYRTDSRAADKSAADASSKKRTDASSGDSGGSGKSGGSGDSGKSGGSGESGGSGGGSGSSSPSSKPEAKSSPASSGS